MPGQRGPAGRDGVNKTIIVRENGDGASGGDNTPKGTDGELIRRGSYSMYVYANQRY